MKRALDLFCGAGGTSMGLHRAGYEVTGVDISPQPNYPFKFVQRDILDIHELGEVDFVWASPPCQAFTAYRRRKDHVKHYPNLIPHTHALLERWCHYRKGHYVIENVPGAPLNANLMLCGSMFGLDVRRHRIFETNFPVEQPGCAHHKQKARFPQATNRKNKRKTVEVGVWRIPLETQRKAMGIDWMTVRELSQAIPPAYSEYIARQI